VNGRDATSTLSPRLRRSYRTRLNALARPKVLPVASFTIETPRTLRVRAIPVVFKSVRPGAPHRAGVLQAASQLCSIRDRRRPPNARRRTHAEHPHRGPDRGRCPRRVPGRSKDVPLTERVSASDVNNAHFAAQLSQGIGWALADAETAEQAVKTSKL
jgi:hypothetical protein